jgi:SnoaL-like domain
MQIQTLKSIDVSRRNFTAGIAAMTFFGTLSPTQVFSASRKDLDKQNKGNGMMLDKRALTYDLYLAAWSAIPDKDRARMLRESLTEDVVFENPQQSRRGIDDVIKHLEEFQARSLGGAFRMNNMVGWGSGALAEWQVVDASGKAGFSGYDVISFDALGLISRILLFANVEPQKLAWRRRDPVSLEVTE